MNNNPERRIAEIVDAAELFRPDRDETDAEKPSLFVEPAQPERSIKRVRDVLANAQTYYDRAGPTAVAADQSLGRRIARPLSTDGVILAVHQLCQPYAIKVTFGVPEEADIRLPRWLANMYLDWYGNWNLKPLNGIACTPLLRDDGTILTSTGYDAETGIYIDAAPNVAAKIPKRPGDDDAAEALTLIRRTFATFCFADAPTKVAPELDVPLIDLDEPPGYDESAFLMALMTAVCRVSLDFAPGVVIHAANVSGAGAGKGLLVRCICLIAQGREPSAITAGSEQQELEKRIAAELITGDPVLFLDNLNARMLRSDLLASAITERPARVRILGKSETVSLNSSAFICLTGNGLTVSEDLVRRLLTVELDPKTEDPEARRFSVNIRKEVMRRRAELLSALLTIWRWGRLHPDLPQGSPLGGFETWCRWVRDPLLALGCKDPVDRIGETKQRDGLRQSTAELFSVWWEHHQDQPVTARQLSEAVLSIINPHGRSRQFVAAELQKLAGTNLAGFKLIRHQPKAKWSPATYKLLKLER